MNLTGPPARGRGDNTPVHAVTAKLLVSRWRRPRLPAVAAALAVVAAACALASLPLYAYNVSRLGGGKVHYFYADALVVGALYPLTGAFLVRRRPRNAVGWLFVLTSILGVNALANQYAVTGLLVEPGRWPGATFAAWVAAWGWTPEIAVLVFLPLLFPDGMLPSPRWRPFARVAAGCLALLVVAAMLTPAPIDASDSISNPAGTTRAFAVIVVVTVAASGLILAPVAVVGLVLRQRRAIGAERAQLQWLSLAAVVAVVVAVAAAPVRPPWQEPMFAVAFAAIPAGIVIAVVRYRLFDVEVVLNRTVVYGLLTSVVLAGYLVAVLGADQAAQRTGLVAVVVLALLAATARDRVQRWVDRLLFGYRKDPYAVVSRVGQRLDDASGPFDALGQLTTELRTVLRLPSAEVIPDDPGLPPAGSGRSVAGTVDLPVAVQGEHVATLRVGRRHHGERFRPDEMSALTDVARRAGALVQAAALIAELQRSRETLVSAREEERRRLHRDLHDGVGPELAGLALQLDSLAARLAGQPDLAERAGVLRDRMRQTVTGVRRVVDDLRPPALDELGLAGALRQHFAVYPATQVIAPALPDRVPAVPDRAGTPGVPDRAGIPAAPDQDGTSAAADPVQVTAGTLPPLPAAVEVAAYRIASEAVANAFRHGHATACTVQLSADHAGLHLEVRDDGTGIPPDALPGVGLASMRDRAAELGGELSIGSGPSGTALHARLPLRTGP